MPRQTSPRTPPKTTPTPPSNGGGKSNGGTTRPASTRRPAGNGGNGKPSGAWPVELVLAAEVELSVEGKDSTVDGFAVCDTCAALLPGSEISRKLHSQFHETVRGLDSRTP
jgi:hypothetical protein